MRKSELEAKISRMKKLLRECQWGFLDRLCPCCLNMECDKHSPTCKLAKELR